MDDPAYLTAILATHLRRLRRHGGVLEDAAAMELGPGRSLGQAVLLCALGARSATAIDVQPYASDAQGQRTYTDIRADIEQLIAGHGIQAKNSPEERGRVLEELLPQESDSPRLGSRLRYEITDGRRIPLDDSSMDFLYSCSVLEHVENVDATYAEMARVTRRGGMWSHMIDLRDHCHPDPHDFLNYNDRLWSVMQSRSPGYTNRLRASDHLRSIQSCGMRVVQLKPTRTEHAPGRGRLHPRFRSYGDDDLRTTNLAVVAIKD